MTEATITDANPGRVMCRDRDGRRVPIEVYSAGAGRVDICLPNGECYELEPLEGVGRLRAVLREKALQSSELIEGGPSRLTFAAWLKIVLARARPR
ncbi:MAG TPA: hypothetical protein VHZ97_14175 [Pseudonocardiaceae bacterium]|jgi:hypothetical protein|nr:hypothetical protein [Pseudonocardiaceae bacterium]